MSVIAIIIAITDILVGDGDKVNDFLFVIYLLENTNEYSCVVKYDVLIITNIYENFLATVANICSSLRYPTNRI
jgi:hypothetical protein